MEKRISKVITSSAGGTAGKGSKTYKISLPSKWINKMHLTEHKIDLCFDGDKIIITPHLPLDSFIKAKKDASHKLLLIEFFNGDISCTKICADYTEQNLAVENYTDHLVKTAFGKNEVPTWQDFENFLEERCIPRSRSGLREYLETIGVEEYDPLEIIKKTQGRMAEDDQWIRLEEI
ncbi:MAG: hypothetical protein IKT38_02600 [Clostridia bacterium]|nr:hypothetical protein [Clostridia bacterium]